MMKKALLLILAMTLCISMTACGKNEQGEIPAPTASIPAEATNAPQEGDKQNPQESAPSEAPKQEESKKKPVVATNTQVVKEDEAPTVYWVMDTYYHLEGCYKADGGHEIAWETVQQIGLRQCSECNPPRYENYVESNN